MSNLVELDFKKTREGTIEEGQGMEKTTYPDVNTFILERVVDEVRTAVILGSKAGQKLTLRIETKVGRR
ncbi:MAG: hypothetical protein GH145_02740 [Firmicutes bacterium]|jgi:hypothetical protein|nr:hypothetical protein [Bacillota bacterium]